jgi:hypothetical protein
MSLYAKMKKCEFCDRSFGEDAYRRHSLHCNKALSHTNCHLETDVALVIKSDEFMQRLEEKFVHAFQAEGVRTENHALASRNRHDQYSVIVNPSPRIVFQEIVREQTRVSLSAPNYHCQKRRASTPGKWRSLIRAQTGRSR